MNSSYIYIALPNQHYCATADSHTADSIVSVADSHTGDCANCVTAGHYYQQHSSALFGDCEHIGLHGHQNYMCF